MQTLGLAPYLDELERLNNQYETLAAQRAADRLANAMTSLAFAWSLANPSDEATAFIRNVNALIADAQTAFNQRRAQKKKSEDDRPVTE